MKTDAELRHDVEQELATDPSVEPSDIGVTVKGGVVTLTGQVSSYHAKFQAQTIVKRLHGVRGLANEMTVVPAGAGPTDTALAEAALAALKWTAAVPAECIKVIVNQGQITLEGKVPRSHQRVAAEEAVRRLEGLKGLMNLIAVDPPSAIDTEIVKRRITEALHRRAQVDAERISVSVHDDTVMLDGDVGSMAEGDEAESAAWGVPGVRYVENNLVVKV